MICIVRAGENALEANPYGDRFALFYAQEVALFIDGGAVAEQEVGVVLNSIFFGETQ